MAQLKEGSVIKKKTGDEIIATVDDIPEIPTSLPANGGNADTIGGFTVGTDVPANAKFTDTHLVESVNNKTGNVVLSGTDIEIGSSSLSFGSNIKIDYAIKRLGERITDNEDKKADKTYVDNKVKTDVPVGAKFTDTVYSHPASHPASMITGLPTSLPANGGNADTVGGFTVGVNVPANAKFTDTNTTYSEISTAEIDAGTASTRRTITGRRVKYILDKISSMISVAIGALTKSSVGLENVDNTSDASKPISTATQTALNGKVNNSQVLTNVPSGAKFTDTITTINGKTGAISKSDITALGVPAQDTVVDISGKADKTEVTSLANKVPSTKELVTVTGKNEHYPIVMDNSGTILGRHLSRVWNWGFPMTTTSLGVGENALLNNTGQESSGFGYQSLQNNTGQTSNGFGHNSLANNTGDSSSGFGYYSLANNIGQSSNGFGYYSLESNAGDYSNGFGHNSLSNNTGDSSNGFGHYSLQNNTGDNSNGVGFQSLYNNTGYDSNGFGHQSLQNNIGDRNTAVGHASNSSFIANVSGNKTCDASDVDVSNSQITIPSHGFGTSGSSTLVRYTSTAGTRIGGLYPGTVYRITIVNPNTIQFEDASIWSEGTGTHTFTPGAKYSNTTSLGANTIPNRSNQVVLGDALVDTVKMGGTYRTPTSSTSPGVKGETCWDSDYFYICVATNTWKRTRLRDIEYALKADDVGLGNVDNVKQMPISGGVLENYREKLITLSGSTSTMINLSLGNVFTHTLTGNTTYVIYTDVWSEAHSFTLIITQTATVRALTFPGNIKWQGGEIPDLSGANKTYVLTFLTIDGGITNWLGMFGGEF